MWRHDEVSAERDDEEGAGSIAYRRGPSAGPARPRVGRGVAATPAWPGRRAFGWARARACRGRRGRAGEAW